MDTLLYQLSYVWTVYRDKSYNAFFVIIETNTTRSRSVILRFSLRWSRVCLYGRPHFVCLLPHFCRCLAVLCESQYKMIALKMQHYWFRLESRGIFLSWNEIWIMTSTFWCRITLSHILVRLIRAGGTLERLGHYREGFLYCYDIIVIVLVFGSLLLLTLHIFTLLSTLYVFPFSIINNYYLPPSNRQVCSPCGRSSTEYGTFLLLTREVSDLGDGSC